MFHLRQYMSGILTRGFSKRDGLCGVVEQCRCVVQGFFLAQLLFHLCVQEGQHILLHISLLRLQAVVHDAGSVLVQLVPRAPHDRSQLLDTARRIVQQCRVKLASNQNGAMNALVGQSLHHQLDILAAHELRGRTEEEDRIARHQELLRLFAAGANRIPQPRRVDDLKTLQQIVCQSQFDVFYNRRIFPLGTDILRQVPLHVVDGNIFLGVQFSKDVAAGFRHLDQLLARGILR